MRFLEVLAAVVALIIDALRERKRQKEERHHEEIQSNPAGELRRRGWLQSDADEGGVPPASPDRDTDKANRQ